MEQGLVWNMAEYCGILRNWWNICSYTESTSQRQNWVDAGGTGWKFSEPGGNICFWITLTVQIFRNIPLNVNIPWKLNINTYLENLTMKSLLKRALQNEKKMNKIIYLTLSFYPWYFSLVLHRYQLQMNRRKEKGGLPPPQVYGAAPGGQQGGVYGVPPGGQPGGVYGGPQAVPVHMMGKQPF